MKHTLAILTAGLATVIAAPLVMCTPHPAHYRVELDIYVADEAALCKRASSPPLTPTPAYRPSAWAR